MSIYKRGDSWCYDFWVRGARYRGTIGNVSRKVANEVHEKRRIEALEGKLLVRPIEAPLFGRFDAESQRFTDAAGKYWDFYHAHRKPSSVIRARSTLFALSQRFASKRLDEIKQREVDEYKANRKVQGKADATVNRELACLKGLFTMAMLWGWITTNPVKSVKFFKENNARQRYLTLEEEKALLECCDFRLAVLVVAAVDTGFRASELASLKWHNVDFEQKAISVASGYTKNGDPRRNPMTQRLAEVLTMLKGVGKASPDAQVFGHYRYHKAFWKARDDAGLGKDVVFHTLRHTFISRLVMAGVDIKTVQELAGHKRIEMTMRYAHLAPGHKGEAICTLESELPTKVPTVISEACVSA